MLLEKKVAIIYGAGGNIGGAVARAFAHEGARVFLAGRTKDDLEKVADDIRSAGGWAELAVVDALDEQAVDRFVDGVAGQAGRIDISFNVIGIGDVQKPLMDISTDEFLQPITTSMRTQFLTTRAAARHMSGQKSGVILTFGGSGPQTVPCLGGFKISLDAQEGLRRQWAAELEPLGIRVLSIKTGGIPETLPENEPERQEIIDSIVDASPMKRAASLADVGAVAVFLASDRAASITNTEVNNSAGSIVD